MDMRKIAKYWYFHTFVPCETRSLQPFDLKFAPPWSYLHQIRNLRLFDFELNVGLQAWDRERTDGQTRCNALRGRYSEGHTIS